MSEPWTRPDLEGWKAIAAAVGRAVRPCQVYASRELDPLPVFVFLGRTCARSCDVRAWLEREAGGAVPDAQGWVEIEAALDRSATFLRKHRAPVFVFLGRTSARIAELDAWYAGLLGREARERAPRALCLARRRADDLGAAGVAATSRIAS